MVQTGSYACTASEPRDTRDVCSQGATSFPPDEPAATMRHSVPDNLATVSASTQKAYLDKAAAREAAVHNYARRVDELREALHVHLHPTAPNSFVLQLTDECFMTRDELLACKRASITESGAIAKALHRRTPRAAGLPNDANALFVQDARGRVLAILVKDAFSDTMAKQGHVALARVHDEHACGWPHGCEVRGPLHLHMHMHMHLLAHIHEFLCVGQADGVVNPELVLHAMRTPEGAKAFGIREGFRVQCIQRPG